MVQSLFLIALLGLFLFVAGVAVLERRGADELLGTLLVVASICGLTSVIWWRIRRARASRDSMRDFASGRGYRAYGSTRPSFRHPARVNSSSVIEGQHGSRTFVLFVYDINDDAQEGGIRWEAPPGLPRFMLSRRAGGLVRKLTGHDYWTEESPETWGWAAGGELRAIEFDAMSRLDKNYGLFGGADDRLRLFFSEELRERLASILSDSGRAKTHTIYGDEGSVLLLGVLPPDTPERAEQLIAWSELFVEALSEAVATESTSCGQG